jgi:hypothetical protein
VAYVSSVEHRYLQDVVAREEGGTPSILGAIRAGLVFQLKEAVGVETIMAREHDFVQRAIERWIDDPNLRILGNPKGPRLGIVSFMIRHGQRYLHHNFVVALLNDLFGIQARGGCSCAGPYGHRLLNIGLTLSQEFKREILRGCEGVKPGWVRINFNYFISEVSFDYIVEAVRLVAREGFKLLPDYEFDPDHGLWRHHEGRRGRVLSLDDLSYGSGRLEYPARHATEPETVLPGYLDQARRILASAECRDRALRDPVLEPGFEALRWFPLPGEVCDELRRRRLETQTER